MAFLDYFSKQSDIYAKARPGYPEELFKYLISLCKEHNVVWDCATGNGQAAVPLANYFNKVIATDASGQQLKHAVKHPKITYRKALAEESGIENESVDLITVANALHWFDANKFFKETDRVLKQGGVLAVWTYPHSYIGGKNDSEINEIVEEFAHGTMKDYWPPETRLATTGYATIQLPFEEISSPKLQYEKEIELEGLLGFFYSWSATQKYINQTGKDPVVDVMSKLSKFWKNKEKRLMTWELAVKAARKA